MKIDYLAVKQLAGDVSRLAGDVSSSSARRIDAILSDLSAHFEGCTAMAFEEKMSQLSEDVDDVARALRSISTELYDYAERIRRTDELLAALIESNGNA
ncbi:MAG: WXG100 family type VII secretion target [Clostridia bacterium]|nr:WXG100 family type VII secretion target [Clostridia bacterium]